MGTSELSHQSELLTTVMKVSQRLFRIHLAWISLLSLIFRFLVPPNPGYGALHDDELMVSLARSILDGDWIGSYQEKGHLLLSKPPGYSMFLAWTHWLPWAPTVSIHLLLIAGFLLVVHELRLLQVSRAICVASFTLFCFYPVWYSETFSRIYRDSLLTALTIIFVGLVLMLKRLITDSARKEKIIGISCCVGLTTGLFYITKPSWHFLLPIYAGILFWSEWKGIFRNPRQVILRSKKYLLATGVAFVSFLLLPGFVMIENHRNYGVFATDSFSSGNFPEAMKAIYSAKERVNRPYIDSTAEARNDLYQVSPTMRKLKDFLELPIDNGWRSQPCHSDLGVCDESGAWFPWEFRDAIEKSGLGNTAEEFEVTAGKIASEIRSGCRTRTIDCEREGIAPGLDSLDTLSPKVLLDSFGKGVQFLVNPSTGYQERGEFRDLTNETVSLWTSTIKGLPPRVFATSYESNDLFLGDIRKLLSQMYATFWIPLLLITFIGLIVPSLRPSRGLQSNFRIAGFSVICAIFILILQISMLQASSGYYMSFGGDLYLLPLHSLLLILIPVGIHRLLLLTIRHSEDLLVDV